ncbi:hypothetical protein V4C53_21850 [Paraburkholderia azotifigens]|uniref:hypothetical protein n=1 Tax=Paraburkholderia azotifigens TaxID=2057004 RepID=UPI0031707E61
MVGVDEAIPQLERPGAPVSAGTAPLIDTTRIASLNPFSLASIPMNKIRIQILTALHKSIQLKEKS